MEYALLYFCVMGVIFGGATMFVAIAAEKKLAGFSLFGIAVACFAIMVFSSESQLVRPICFLVIGAGAAGVIWDCLSDKLSRNWLIVLACGVGVLLTAVLFVFGAFSPVKKSGGSQWHGDGVNTCKNCGSSRDIQFTGFCRSCDEAFWEWQADEY